MRKKRRASKKNKWEKLKDEQKNIVIQLVEVGTRTFFVRILGKNMDKWRPSLFGEYIKYMKKARILNIIKIIKDKPHLWYKGGNADVAASQGVMLASQIFYKAIKDNWRNWIDYADESKLKGALEIMRGYANDAIEEAYLKLSVEGKQDE